MKVLVIGYFGYKTNQIDGQTIRTRSIYNLLKEDSNLNLYFFDTQSFQESKLRIFKLIKLLVSADVVFNISAHRNLKYLLPLVFLITKVTNKKLNYIAVGGWLFEFLKNKPIHRYMLKKINGVYVQTDNLRLTLKSVNFKNVYLLNNFRPLQFPKVNVVKNNKSETIKLVFMARVHPLKGVNLLFDMEEEINKAGIENVFIDIYGPVFKDYEEEFTSKLKNSEIKYRGILAPSEIYDVLQNYDLMLFPTKYYTEGFPGTILDAYISGLLVIATKWLNAEEFVEHGKTGFIVPFDDDEVFIQEVINIAKNPNIITELKKAALLKREEYSADRAWGVLKKAIYNV